MTNGVKNVPELRFPEFDGGWEEKQLSTILEIGTGKSKVQSNESGKYNILGSTGIIGKSHTYDYEGDFILTARVGHYAGKLYKHAGKVNISDNTIYLFNFINKNFIYESLNVFKLEKLVFGSGQPLIKASDLKKLKIRVPVSKEQKKIGVFFSKLDRQIELEEQKLAKLEEQKKGYMQKIFSQELRFKDENGNDYPNWIFEELNNIFTKYQNTIYLHDNEEYKRISISNKGKITHRDITFGKTIGRKRQYLIDLKKHPNTLTFIRQGVFLGGIGFIPISLDGYIVTENMPLLSMSEEYSKKFMTYLFSSESYYKSVIFKNLPTGSAQKALHEKDWLKSFVNIPVYSEQEKIGNFFEKQDNLIKKQSDKVELLKERKKGFLQKMFV
ncbi:restriction endonuclease subunit S [Staphylococcus sp. GDH8C107P]|uniref:restriction endonuclease subunit S n=1 Tax=Staphylococcus sp. GDH8C107P TaxID=2804087 RepID=UPI001AEBF9D1|nr:restriction endonuclease subunit S [Staphylococcus sp. GDH8C107P]